MKHCLNCGKPRERHSKQFCNVACYSDYTYKENVRKWLSGEINGHINSKNHNIKSFVRKYVLELYNFKCSKCGFSGINPYSNNTILQIDHTDGNSENSSFDNLKPLCPNCHALTETFMCLNRGKSTRSSRYK